MCFKSRLIKQLFILLLVLFTGNTFAQQNISGTVDNSDGQAVEYAVVSLLKSSDSAVLANVLTDSNGKFRLDAPAGDMLISISAAGYKPVNRKVMIDTESPPGLLFTLERSAQALDEVTISSTKPLFERKPDRMIYNVSARITAIGSNALETLRKTPGVLVQQRDYSIALAGKSGVLILVNDRPMQLAGEDLFAWLEALPSANIERIEVITAPPAKYDAAGNSGLINIVMKVNNKTGLNGSVRAGYEQASYGRGIAGGDINYRGSKINLFGNINYTNGSNQVQESVATPYPQQEFYVQDNYKKTLRPLQYSLGLDYDIHKNAVLGLWWMSSNNDRVDNSVDLIEVRSLPQRMLDSTMKTIGRATRKNSNNVLNVNYAWKIDTTGKSLTLNVNRLWFNGSRTNDFTTTYYPDNITPVNSIRNGADGQQEIGITTAQADVTLPYSFAALSFGTKFSFINNESNNNFGYYDNNVFHRDAAISTGFNYKERVQALYISAERSVGKWSFQAGLRGEYTQTEGYSRNLNQTNTNQYFNLFPTAYVQFQPDENNNWNLNYSKRINRPDYRSLDPFRAYATPWHYGQGNPFLRPSFNHNLELDYTFKGRYTLSAFYQYEKNHFGSVWMIDPVANVTSGVSMNFANFYNYGLYATASLQPVDRWEMLAQLGVQHTMLESMVYSSVEQSYRQWSGYVSVNNSFAFNKARTIMAELNAYWLTKHREDFLEIGSMGSVDAGVRVLFFNKKLNLGLNAADMLKTLGAQGVHVVTGQTINNYFDNRNLRFTATYKFGNTKLKAKRERQTGIEEEKGRAG